MTAAGADSGWTDVSRRSPTTVKYVVTNKVQQQLAKRDRVAGGRGELGKGLGAVASREAGAEAGAGVGQLLLLVSSFIFMAFLHSANIIS